ncbi:phage scaffolding protein [Streptococcus ruminantium]|uniref:phage scaffolding protein n=1 Tax=Streptococcus ruminantium TaxID=1917441 RepID=UPI0012DF2E44|nr:phage scaffolding protein [Streptococcus ruminantium]
MKREFLAGLELSDELIDKIMAEHGKTISDTKSKLAAAEGQVSTLQADLSTANETISNLQKSNEDNAELQKSIEDYKNQLEEAQNQRAIDRKNAFIELGLTKAGVRNSKAAKALLDLDKIKESDNGYDGFDDQVKALQESDSYLFNNADDKPEPTPQITATGNPAPTDNNEQDAFAAVVARYQ